MAKRFDWLLPIRITGLAALGVLALFLRMIVNLAMIDRLEIKRR